MRISAALTAIVVGTVLVCGPTLASAQDSIALYGDTGDGLSRYIDTTTGTTTFDIVAFIDPALGLVYAEFKLEPLQSTYPGVFLVAYHYPGINSHTVSYPEHGEYAIFLNWGAACMEPGPIEVARLTYLDMNGIIGDNVVITPSPLGPDDPTFSNCFDTMCYGGCPEEYLRHPLAPAPWVDYGIIDPTWIPGVENSDGVLVLNPDAIAVGGAASSMGTLKARY